MRHQLEMCSDPCIQNQSKAMWHLNRRTNMTTDTRFTIKLLIICQYQLCFILDGQPVIQILN